MNTTLLRAAAVLAMPMVLVGCRAGYDVDARNQTDQPVTLRISQPHGDGAGQVLAMKRLGPGDRGSLFAQTGAMKNVTLEADFEGNIGYPAIIDLARGKTVVNVTRIDEGSKGRIRLEELQR